MYTVFKTPVYLIQSTLECTTTSYTRVCFALERKSEIICTIKNNG